MKRLIPVRANDGLGHRTAGVTDRDLPDLGLEGHDAAGITGKRL